MKRVLVTGGAGYVGRKLVLDLISRQHYVDSVDLVQSGYLHLNLASYNRRNFYIGDIRDTEKMRNVMDGCDTVIHLACLSNDPTADLDPALTKSINLDSFRPLVKAAKRAGVKRFIFASSSSVYGVKQDKDVTEDLPLEPLTDYSKYKAECEQILLEEREPGFEAVIIRPATVCGYSPSMRLDLLVNIFVHHAMTRGVINVHGGNQYRPNIHIDDMVDAYLTLLEAPAELVDGQIFNCGTQNLTLLETALMVANIVDKEVRVNVEESRDPRSYHVNSDKITRVLGWKPQRSIEDAIREMVQAFKDGRILEPDNDKYYRIRSIKNMGLAA